MGPVRVTDPADPRVADFAGLREHWREGRDDYFVAEGQLVVEQLLRSSYRVRTVLVSERLMPRLDLPPVAVPVCVASEDVLRALCGFDFHRGVLASADRGPLPEAAAVAAATDFLLLVEGVNDHENVGALFRNAAAFGVGGVVLDPTTCDPLYRRSIRVSMGHVLHVPFARADPWLVFLRHLADNGYDVAALGTARDAVDLRRAPRAPRQAVLVGAEGHGLRAATLVAASRQVRVAMAAGVDSLNVATAAAVALHHWAGDAREPGAPADPS